MSFFCGSTVSVRHQIFMHKRPDTSYSLEQAISFEASLCIARMACEIAPPWNGRGQVVSSRLKGTKLNSTTKNTCRISGARDEATSAGRIKSENKMLTNKSRYNPYGGGKETALGLDREYRDPLCARSHHPHKKITAMLTYVLCR